MFKIAVCDDVPLHAKLIMGILDMYNEERPGVRLRAAIFGSSEKLLESLSKGHAYDMFLLDIIMPNIDGISLAQQIRMLDENVPVVFITQSSDNALNAFGVSAVQYIVKPVTKAALFNVLDKIIATKKPESDNIITVSAPGRVIALFHSSIVVAENSSRTLRFHLNTGEVVESKAIRTTFSAALEGLLKDSRFLFVHQSYVINMMHVKELRSSMVLMNNGIEVPIPRPKYSAIKKAYLKYVRSNQI
ncbi:MAG: LytTR family DNA-binding domain-containing protein [Defluviitaleaceae bacterium]|nr:LytTR family DNA-binding domain-containing protein [Defluviitaleaceae bacterium]